MNNQEEHLQQVTIDIVDEKGLNSKIVITQKSEEDWRLDLSTSMEGGFKAIQDSLVYQLTCAIGDMFEIKE